MNKQINEGFKPLFNEVAINQRKFLKALEMLKRDNQLQVVYIAGKVTGLDYNSVVTKFSAKANELSLLGFITINPCDFIMPDEDWHTAMALCASLLPLADFICLLHDWQYSKGATLEKELADQFGIPQFNPAMHGKSIHQNA